MNIVRPFSYKADNLSPVLHFADGTITVSFESRSDGQGHALGQVMYPSASAKKEMGIFCSAIDDPKYTTLVNHALGVLNSDLQKRNDVMDNERHLANEARRAAIAEVKLSD